MNFSLCGCESTFSWNPYSGNILKYKFMVLYFQILKDVMHRQSRKAALKKDIYWKVLILDTYIYTNPRSQDRVRISKNSLVLETWSSSLVLP